MRTDPSVREDGRCVQCKGKRTITPEARKYAGWVLDADPFCSTTCARAFYGTTLPKHVQGSHMVRSGPPA